MSKRGQKAGAQLPSRYKAGYISLMNVVLLKDKKADGRLWREFKEDDMNRGAMAGNVISLDVAWWVWGWLKILWSKEVEVKMLSGEIETISMDDFKELIEEMKDEHTSD